MEQPTKPGDETQRLRSLQVLGLLDTLPEERFDRITRLAARLFDVPISLISLVDRERQWFKSRHGLDASQTSREVSFCGHAILEEKPLIVTDSLRDPRFADNPLVTGAPGVRFYAGHPIHGADGSRVGTMCVIDHRPREFTAEQRASLADLAAMVDQELSLLSLTMIDELTQLANRRGFTECARYVLALCRRHAETAVLVSIDLDGFKHINDTFGHAAGDEVLKQFATLLLKNFRTADVIARLGGDEFSVLLGGTGESQAVAALARLRAAVAAAPALAQHAALSFSYGLTVVDPAVAPDLEQLLESADRRMYDAKRLARSHSAAASR
jgi:diguanylate cyclase (GGDEF)-like protein